MSVFSKKHASPNRASQHSAGSSDPMEQMEQAAVTIQKHFRGHHGRSLCNAHALALQEKSCEKTLLGDHERLQEEDSPSAVPPEGETHGTGSSRRSSAGEVAARRAAASGAETTADTRAGTAGAGEGAAGGRSKSSPKKHGDKIPLLFAIEGEGADEVTEELQQLGSQSTTGCSTITETWGESPDAIRASGQAASKREKGRYGSMDFRPADRAIQQSFMMWSQHLQSVDSMQMDMDIIDQAEDDFLFNAWGETRLRVRNFGLWFNVVVTAFVVLNAITIGIETDLKESHPAIQPILGVLEHVYCTVFFVEMVIRIGILHWKYFKRASTCLDFLLVLCAITEAWVLPLLGVPEASLKDFSLFRMIRLLRLVRLVKMFKSFKELWLLVCGLVQGLNTLFWVGILMWVVLYAFSILAVQTIDKELYGDLFGTVPFSMLTLWECLNDGCTADVIRPVLSTQPMYAFYFLVFVLLMVFGVLNILIGVFVEGMVASAEEQKACFARKQDSTCEDLIALWNAADTDDNDKLSRDELLAAIENVEMQDILLKLDLGGIELGHLFTVMDKSQDGNVSIGELVGGIMHYQSSLKNMDVSVYMLVKRIESELILAIKGLRELRDRTRNKMREKARAAVAASKARGKVPSKAPRKLGNDVKKKLGSAMTKMTERIIPKAVLDRADVEAEEKAELPRHSPGKSFLHTPGSHWADGVDSITSMVDQNEQDLLQRPLDEILEEQLEYCSGPFSLLLPRLLFLHPQLELQYADEQLQCTSLWCFSSTLLAAGVSVFFAIRNDPELPGAVTRVVFWAVVATVTLILGIILRLFHKKWDSNRLCAVVAWALAFFTLTWPFCLQARLSRFFVNANDDQVIPYQLSRVEGDIWIQLGLLSHVFLASSLPARHLVPIPVAALSGALIAFGLDIAALGPLPVFEHLEHLFKHEFCPLLAVSVALFVALRIHDKNRRVMMLMREKVVSKLLARASGAIHSSDSDSPGMPEGTGCFKSLESTPEQALLAPIEEGDANAEPSATQGQSFEAFAAVKGHSSSRAQSDSVGQLEHATPSESRDDHASKPSLPLEGGVVCDADGIDRSASHSEPEALSQHN